MAPDDLACTGAAQGAGGSEWQGEPRSAHRGRAEAVHHGGDGGRVGDSARLQPRRPLAKAAQEQDAATAARGSGEARPLERGD